MRVVVDLLPSSFSNSTELAEAARLMLEGVANVNRLLIRSGRVPPLLQSGVRYRPERAPPGHEEFASADVVYARQCGDCDDLAAWMVAEEREKGCPATLRVYWQEYGGPPGQQMFHCEARIGSSLTIWDPSRMLGM